MDALLWIYPQILPLKLHFYAKTRHLTREMLLAVIHSWFDLNWHIKHQICFFEWLLLNGCNFCAWVETYIISFVCVFSGFHSQLETEWPSVGKSVCVSSAHTLWKRTSLLRFLDRAVRSKHAHINTSQSYSWI